MENKLEMIDCSTCNGPMPKLRKELYGYNFCVKCSTVLPKVGRVVTYGQGEDIWNDVEILDQESAKRILELEQLSSGKLENLDLLDYNNDSLDQLDERYKHVGSVRELLKNYDPYDFDHIQLEPVISDEDDEIIDLESDDDIIEFE